MLDPRNTFTGTIDPASRLASGTANGPGGPFTWQSPQNFTCSDAAAAEPETAPADSRPTFCSGTTVPVGEACPPKAAPKPANNVTVLKESDVYDGPDGTGNRLGPPSYFLASGRTLPLAEPCRNEWCLLNIPDAEVPGGKGWVYAGDGFLKVP